MIKRKKEVFSHLDAGGKARMVDVSAKPTSSREARAEATVWVGRVLGRALQSRGTTHKGNVLDTARLAGIMAAKRTSELIPLCHPLPIDGVVLELAVKGERVRIEARVVTRAATGVEMEALTAASIAALTVYDMCKSFTKGLIIESVRLLEKRGGRSGHWLADASARDPSAKGPARRRSASHGR